MTTPETAMQTSHEDENHRHREGRLRQWFRRLRRSRTDPNPVDDALAPPVKDIHTEVGDRLNAYALFKPQPSDSIDLFHVVYIHGGRVPRHRSPELTGANLKTICETMAENEERYNIKPPLSKMSLRRLRDQMNKIKSYGNNEQPIFAAVAADSMQTGLDAGGSLQVPAVLTGNLDHSRNKMDTRGISISVRHSDKYDGGRELAALIWTNGDVLFREILLELQADLEVPNDRNDQANLNAQSAEPYEQRRLIAIVTKKIVGDILTLTETANNSFFNLSAGGPEGTGSLAVRVNRSQLDRHVNDHVGGIIGIQYIMFPVKMLGPFQFRFFPGIHVLKNPDDETGMADTSKVSRYMRWMNGDNANDIPCARSCDVHINSACLSCSAKRGCKARSAPSLPTNLLLGEECSVPMFSTEDDTYFDVTVRRNDECIDMDLRPYLNDFAMDQCELAAQKRARADWNASEGIGCESRTAQRLRSTVLLRSALRKLCYESTLRALCDLAHCYCSGVGVAREKDTASALQYCARFLGQAHESQGVWKQLLSEKSSFLRELKPEKRVIEVIGISGPREYFVLSPLPGLFEVFIAAKSISKLCDSHGYRYMLLAVIVYLYTVASGRSVTVLNLALLLRYGNAEIQKDIQTAVLLCQQVAEREDMAAVDSLVLLCKGNDADVEQNVPVLVEQYLQATTHVEATPMLNVALLLEDGDDCVVNSSFGPLVLMCHAIRRHDTIAIHSLTLHLEHELKESHNAGGGTVRDVVFESIHARSDQQNPAVIGAVTSPGRDECLSGIYSDSATPKPMSYPIMSKDAHRICEYQRQHHPHEMQYQHMCLSEMTYELCESKKRAGATSENLQEAFEATAWLCDDIIREDRRIINIDGALAEYFVARQLVSEILKNYRGHLVSDALKLRTPIRSRRWKARESGPFGTKIRRKQDISSLRIKSTRPVTLALVRTKVAMFMTLIASKISSPMLLSSTAKTSYSTTASWASMREAPADIHSVSMEEVDLTSGTIEGNRDSGLMRTSDGSGRLKARENDPTGARTQVRGKVADFLTRIVNKTRNPLLRSPAANNSHPTPSSSTTLETAPDDIPAESMENLDGAEPID